MDRFNQLLKEIVEGVDIKAIAENIFKSVGGSRWTRYT